MTKFGTPPSLANREPRKYGPAPFHSPMPRIAQSITPRDRVGDRGGGVSAASTFYSTPRDRASVASFQSFTARKPADKEKRWSLRGWDVPNKPERPDEGIVGWEKRRSNLEAKRGTKKHSPILDNEHYFPVRHRCTATEDFEQFRSESLHCRFLQNIKVNAPQKPAVTFKYSNSNKTQNESAPVDHASRNRGKEEQEGEKDTSRTDMLQSYRNAKYTGELFSPAELLGRRSKSVPDLNARNNAEQRNKIKRLLKFSNKGGRRIYKFEEDEDEGYSSKTSSAETKALTDSEEDIIKDTLSKNRLSNSMIDLSELPSNFNAMEQDKEERMKGENKESNTNTENEAAKVRFSYTHQPTILQIPNPEMKLVHNKFRVEKPATSEEVPFSYSRLKRAKEMNRSYRCDVASKLVHENALYDINSLQISEENPKPMTLVLRKICIQDAEQQVTSIMNTNTPPLIASKASPRSRPGSRAGSSAGSALSRSASVMSSTSNAGSTRSRTGSAKSRVNSATARSIVTPQMEFKNRMQQKQARGNYSKDKNQDANTSKEPMWSQEYSLIERQASSYCIGDLIPAMDKSIYTNQFVKGKLGTKQHSRRYHGMAPLLTDSGREEGRATRDDGFMLLQKGMDALAGDMEKLSALANYPLQNKKKTLSPVHGKGHYSPLRFNSERGPRPMMQSPEKETQRKLKEAFTKFYQNRPKEIGKEFRRMQTMWNG